MMIMVGQGKVDEVCKNAKAYSPIMAFLWMDRFDSKVASRIAGLAGKTVGTIVNKAPRPSYMYFLFTFIVLALWFFFWNGMVDEVRSV